jgi:hypothetical protein
VRAALLLLFFFFAVPAAGAETGAETDAGEAKSEAAVENVSPIDEETLEILRMSELLEMLELLEDMDILARMEEKK